MGDARLAGVALELLVAAVVVAAGGGAWAGRGHEGRPGRVWTLLWGAPPTRTEAVALVVLGAGVGVWALSQARDRAMGQAVVGLVLVLAAGTVMAVSALSRPEEEIPPRDTPGPGAHTREPLSGEQGPEVVDLVGRWRRHRHRRAVVGQRHRGGAPAGARRQGDAA